MRNLVLAVLLTTCLVTAPLSVLFAGDLEPVAELVTDTRPAVDGVNTKLSIDHTIGGRDALNVSGSITLPLGHAFGLQLDGGVTEVDFGALGDLSIYSAGSHLFWRDPSRGMLGAYGQVTHLDILGGLNLYAGAGEGAIYWNRFSLDTVVGFKASDYTTKLFSDVKLAYYPTDDLRLEVGHGYMFDAHILSLGSEWAVAREGGVASSLYANAHVSEHGDAVVRTGVRLYWGQSDKSLIRRHREDDPQALFAKIVVAGTAIAFHGDDYPDFLLMLGLGAGIWSMFGNPTLEDCFVCQAHQH